MDKLGIIGGTGLTSLDGLEIVDTITCDTVYGKPSSDLVLGRFAGSEVLFLARHGNPHSIPPHKVNYRANIQALHDNGIRQVLAVNAVGGITTGMHPQRIVIPDQVIDYTWSRAHTFFEEELEHVNHVDFTNPYSHILREKLKAAADAMKIDVIDTGTYGATQGPRLESSAEIRRMKKDGCDIVGMTGMPEAGLAREKGMEYASLSLVVNWAAGQSEEEITMDIIEDNLRAGMQNILVLIAEFLGQQD